MDVLNIILKAAGAFAICFAVVYSALYLYRKWKEERRKRKQQYSARTKELQKEAEKKQRGFRINKMDVILIVIAVTLFAFTLKMIELFETYMAVPDTLIACVFGICGGECGAMSWIKTSNEKYRDRRWQLEDEKRMEEAAKRAASDE